MLNSLEIKILRMIAESQLLTKPELLRKLNGSGTSVVESATKNLMQKNFLASISPIGSTCYIVTQKGTRYLQDTD